MFFNAPSGLLQLVDYSKTITSNTKLSKELCWRHSGLHFSTSACPVTLFIPSEFIQSKLRLRGIPDGRNERHPPICNPLGGWFYFKNHCGIARLMTNLILELCWSPWGPHYGGFISLIAICYPSDLPRFQLRKRHAFCFVAGFGFAALILGSGA